MTRRDIDSDGTVDTTGGGRSPRNGGLKAVAPLALCLAASAAPQTPLSAEHQALVQRWLAPATAPQSQYGDDVFDSAIALRALLGGSDAVADIEAAYTTLVPRANAFAELAHLADAAGNVELRDAALAKIEECELLNMEANLQPQLEQARARAMVRLQDQAAVDAFIAESFAAGGQLGGGFLGEIYAAYLERGDAQAIFALQTEHNINLANLANEIAAWLLAEQRWAEYLEFSEMQPLRNALPWHPYLKVSSRQVVAGHPDAAANFATCCQLREAYADNKHPAMKEQATNATACWSHYWKTIELALGGQPVEAMKNHKAQAPGEQDAAAEGNALKRLAHEAVVLSFLTNDKVPLGLTLLDQIGQPVLLMVEIQAALIEAGELDKALGLQQLPGGATIGHLGMDRGWQERTRLLQARGLHDAGRTVDAILHLLAMNTELLDETIALLVEITPPEKLDQVLLAGFVPYNGMPVPTQDPLEFDAWGGSMSTARYALAIAGAGVDPALLDADLGPQPQLPFGVAYAAGVLGVTPSFLE